MNGVKEVSDALQINENNIFHPFAVTSTGTMEIGRRQVYLVIHIAAAWHKHMKAGFRHPPPGSPRFTLEQLPLI